MNKARNNHQVKQPTHLFVLDSIIIFRGLLVLGQDKEGARGGTMHRVESYRG